MPQLTRLDVEGGVAIITMDDGKANVMSAAMLNDIARKLDAAEKEGAIPVLTGRKGIFSAGFDLKTLSLGGDATNAMVGAGMKLILKMLEHPRPIVAACTGHAFPMGAFLMLSADARFGVPGDWKIGLNEVAIGLTVPHFAVALARHRLTSIGFSRITTGSLFAPDEAAKMGYLDYVVPEDQLLDRAASAARSMQALSMPDYVETKRRVNEPLVQTIKQSEEYAILNAAA